jgi:hypothetical protein
MRLRNKLPSLAPSLSTKEKDKNAKSNAQQLTDPQLLKTKIEMRGNQHTCFLVLDLSVEKPAKGGQLVLLLWQIE